jgi:hypothetical protein
LLDWVANSSSRPRADAPLDKKTAPATRLARLLFRPIGMVDDTRSSAFSALSQVSTLHLSLIMFIAVPAAAAAGFAPLISVA